MKRKIKMQQTKRRTQQRNNWDMLKQSYSQHQENDEDVANNPSHYTQGNIEYAE